MCKQIVAGTFAFAIALVSGIDGQSGVVVTDPTGATVFLNRRGGVYSRSFLDDAATNRSPIVSRTSTVPAFSGDDDDWDTVVRHTRTMFAPFDVSIVEEEPPASTFYVEAVVVGRPEAIGSSPGILGVAGLFCAPIRGAIVFVFSDNANGDNVLISQTIAHEVGHAFGLDHEFLCKDPMSLLAGCGEKRFQDRDAACGENSERPCSCTVATQNSFDTIRGAFGSRDGTLQPRAAEALDVPVEPTGICETPHPRGGM